ncbi:hypothetical protein JD844_015307 [Phrynosoma platyrhinos]|uniref:RING-type domain-containing protein n=1 Tax=Phrynosoma platyrhinos TaxID=52577 RepID=A0ABQ7T191_PHRPL|nr:hypothetical protein JD844_015307 [Phrynosoma platyrhinos]
MAGSSSPPAGSLLRESLCCPLCRGLLRDPVMLSGCGHNLCRECAAQRWAPLERSLLLRCPRCLQSLPLQRLLLRPNPALAALALGLGLRRAEEAAEATPPATPAQQVVVVGRMGVVVRGEAEVSGE